MTFLFCLPSLNFYLRHIELHLYSASCELAHTYRSSLGCWLINGKEKDRLALNSDGNKGSYIRERCWVSDVHAVRHK